MGEKMTTETGPSYFPSMPPTFGWRRVIDLADEFKVNSTDMVAICNRLGLIVADASEWLDADSVDLIRSAIATRGAKGVLAGTEPETKARKEPKPPKPEKVRAPKPEKPVKVREVKLPKPPKPPKPVKVREVKPPKPPKPVKVRE